MMIELGLDIQTTNPYGQPNLISTRTAGATYDLQVPIKNATNALRERNAYPLIYRGRRNQMKPNGKHVIDRDIVKWRTPHTISNGSWNKFPLTEMAFRRKE